MNWPSWQPEALDWLPYRIWQALCIFLVLQIPPILVSGLVWLERRLSAWIQDRLGPNRVGPFGLLQSVADLAKFVFKEDVVPGQANRALFIMAPALALVPSFMTFSLLPFAERFKMTDLDTGLLMLFALSSLAVYGIQIGGWASNSKYALLGGVRASAQIISYELTMGLAAAVVVLFTGTLKLSAIVEWQAETRLLGFLPAWTVFVFPAGTLAFLVFITSAFAETNRLPFDMPEAESELCAGYHTEYSSMKFALFFLGEYTAMIVMSGLMTTLFFGGWSLFGLEKLYEGTITQTLIQTGIWWAKTLAFLVVYIWIRWTLPRFRYDQLMRLGWKIFLPFSLANLLLAAWMRTWGIGGRG
ncbi:MAG TPA: NADH-quinone oxidoreductase subunit NuoH [Planctomycetota bacterium]|nr:NADH-quinone oxidoreductase subunit NuoH [Planctomycetota bacterium]